jgi:hypothetical protein
MIAVAADLSWQPKGVYPASAVAAATGPSGVVPGGWLGWPHALWLATVAARDADTQECAGRSESLRRGPTCSERPLHP